MTATAASIGDRYQGPEGETYIVVQIDNGDELMVMEDFEILEHPDSFDWNPMTFEAVEHTWGALTPIAANPQMTRLVQKRIAREEEIANVVASVPADKQRDLYNQLAAVKHYTAKLAEAQGEVDRIAAQRADQMRKLVDIVGTQTATAKLLGINQSNLSRALRPRS